MTRTEFCQIQKYNSILNTMNNDSQTLRRTFRRAIQKTISTSSSQWPTLAVGMDLSNESVDWRRGSRRIKHLLSWIATVGLHGKVVSPHDQSMSRAMEKMQAFPQHFLDEAMRKLGNIMQNRLLTTVNYPDVSTDFLAPMRFFHKFISTLGKDIGLHNLTHYNYFHGPKAFGKEKVKSYAPDTNPTGDPEALIYFHATSDPALKDGTGAEGCEETH